MPAKRMAREQTVRGHGPLLHSDEHHGVERKPGHRALRKGRVSLPGQIYVVTAVVRERQPLFADFNSACAAAACFEQRSLLGNASMLAWVLMPDHVHWLIQLAEHDDISGIVNRLKSASARAVNHAIGRDGSLWAPTFHDRALRSEEDIQSIARYIVANPLRAGLAKRVGDYAFWNAAWLD